MSHTVTQSSIVTTIRLPRVIVDEVRTIAQRDLERESVTLRRLIRRGLALERRDHEGDEAA